MPGGYYTIFVEGLLGINIAINSRNCGVIESFYRSISNDILQRSTNLKGNANAIKQNIQNQNQNTFV